MEIATWLHIDESLQAENSVIEKKGSMLLL
jgi:hypothetical protein